ncbi:MAG: ABC transporter substrate-binding protein [Nitrospiraceae bacterium]
MSVAIPQQWNRRPVMRWGALLMMLWVFVTVPPDSTDAHEIAVLKSADIAAYNQAVAGLKAELPDSSTITEYDMQGDVSRGRKLARKIRASDASVVITVGLKAALVAKLEIVDVPIIYCMVLDPAKYDLHAPNMTGISLQVPIARQFGTMQLVLPNLKKIGVVYDPEKTGPFVEDARQVAKGLGFELVERQVSSEKELPAALRAIVSKVDAFWLIPDSTILTEESLRFVLSTALDRNVPVIGFSSEFVRNGALVGLSVNSEDIGKQAGAMARRILKGQNAAPPATVPPDRVRFALNLKTAKFLGLELPSEVVGRADEVY